MAVLCSIIQPRMLEVFQAEHDLSFGRTIARELVGCHHARCCVLLFERLPEQTLGTLHVASALYQDTEHDPRAGPLRHSQCSFGGPERNLIEMSNFSGSRKTPADLGTDAWLNFRCRTVSWPTRISRAASISLTMRRLNGNRKYNQRASLITSAVKRWRAS